MDPCPMCEGDPKVLGRMGDLLWLRCKECGWDYNMRNVDGQETNDQDGEEEGE